MLQLPISTEVRRQLPKAQLYKQFDWSPSQRSSFDADVSRLDFVNFIAPSTLPAIAEGSEVKEIFVIEVSLKKQDFDTKNILLLAKSIPQRVLYLLHYQDEAMLAVFHARLFTTAWQPLDAASLPLSGLDLDAAWENIVSAVGDFKVEQKNTLSEQIKKDTEHNKLVRKIETLEKKMRTTKQPRQRRELFLEISRLKQTL